MIVLIAAGFLLSLGLTGSEHVLNFQLTDPPQVPAGTQALVISYSSVRAHLSGPDNNTGWISGTGSGTVDLMGLVNSSTLIGSAIIPANASIDQVSFAVTSSYITINGTTYNVTVPGGQITAAVNAERISNGSILIDLSPTIVTLVTDNSTVFVMLPSVKAVFVGSRKLVNPARLRGFQEGENITVGSSGLSSFGNNMTFSVTVRNNGNRSMDIRDVFLYGNFSVLLLPAMDAQSKQYPDAGGDVHQNLGTILNDRGVQIDENGSVDLNSPGMVNLVRLGVLIRNIKALGFVVGSNGQLSLPYGDNATYGSGYLLAPGASATFSFSGTASFDSGRIVISPVTGTGYKVVVGGDDGLYAYTNTVDT
ncbi:MAG TPA: DUF4382 domain-containing protein [Candidatus Saccharimonadales bacterium]|nr:DUF4382 domain-containing protein [Candidatus Saccharimonadales bacterium]